MRNKTSKKLLTSITAGALTLALFGCATAGAEEKNEGEWSASSITIDWATYNPLSLIIKENKILEEKLGETVTVEWVQSAGSNKANELLRSGAADVASTAGSAALLARANGSPIKVINIYSQPEWSAIVVAADSEITDIAQLKGKSIAATKATDPYFFLLKALESAGLDQSDVEIQNVQHADGRALLDSGAVDAWSGLDPIMAAAEVESNDKLIYRNLDFLTYGFLNATETFISDHADLAQAVVDAYEEARAWAVENPEETAQLLADISAIDIEVARTVIAERSNLDVSGIPGAAQTKILQEIAPIIAASGDVVGGEEALDEAINSIVFDEFAVKAAK